MPGPRAIVKLAGWLLSLAGWMLVACPVVLAENIVVRNKSASPVAVQAATVLRGMLVRDRVHLLQANESTPAIALPGNKVVTIFDARNANRVLIQVPVNASPEDILFDVNSDPNSPTGVRLDRVPRR